jgi:hypothetical protein
MSRLSELTPAQVSKLSRQDLEVAFHALMCCYEFSFYVHGFERHNVVDLVNKLEVDYAQLEAGQLDLERNMQMYEYVNKNLRGQLRTTEIQWTTKSKTAEVKHKSELEELTKKYQAVEAQHKFEMEALTKKYEAAEVLIKKHESGEMQHNSKMEELNKQLEASHLHNEQLQVELANARKHGALSLRFAKDARPNPVPASTINALHIKIKPYILFGNGTVENMAVSVLSGDEISTIKILKKSLVNNHARAFKDEGVDARSRSTVQASDKSAARYSLVDELGYSNWIRSLQAGQKSKGRVVDIAIPEGQVKADGELLVMFVPAGEFVDMERGWATVLGDKDTPAEAASTSLDIE